MAQAKKKETVQVGAFYILQNKIIISEMYDTIQTSVIISKIILNQSGRYNHIS